MRYHLLATDYDGTIATDGRVTAGTLAALRAVLATGRRLVLVTGRELDELMSVHPDLSIFERVVAENGALLYRPATKERRRLAEPPPPRFLAALRQRGVAPLSAGEVIVATREPHEAAVLEAIRELGLELQVIFNKGAVMILPAGVNKATGLTAALEELKISPHNVVGVGDAENDHSFLKLCERSAAVGGALPAIRDTADLILRGDAGAGVDELAAELIATDLEATRSPDSQQLTFGVDEHGMPVTLEPYGDCILVCGASASGKSTVARRVVESLHELSYQFCIIDPEGDYEEQPGAVVIGKPDAEPRREEVVQLLEDYGVNGVVCMTGVPISDRPPLLLGAADGSVAAARALRPTALARHRRGAPPAAGRVGNSEHPAAGDARQRAARDGPSRAACRRRCRSASRSSSPSGRRLPSCCDSSPRCAACRCRQSSSARLAKPVEVGEVLLWSLPTTSCRRVRIEPPSAEQRRHTRKYAVGQLPPDRSFYFRGPEGKLNLRAQNLLQFLEVAAGRRRRHVDVSLPARRLLALVPRRHQGSELAAAAAAVERDRFLSRDNALAALRTAVESRYTLPADAPLPVRGAS